MEGHCLLRAIKALVNFWRDTHEFFEQPLHLPKAQIVLQSYTVQRQTFFRRSDNCREAEYGCSTSSSWLTSQMRQKEIFCDRMHLEIFRFGEESVKDKHLRS